ncbi:MAG: hypothetical protein MPJ22_06350, partial [Pirellulales bacterium]|nr:hypothetical protein [Pirellulales bacterium]
TKDTVTVFSDQSIRGPDIVIEDDDASGGQISLHLSLAGPDGRPITRLEAGQRTDAYLMAEVREVGDRNAARKVALDSALSVGIALTTGANWLNRVELGNPVLPGAVMIRPGQSRGLSAQAFSITPSKTGAFGFRATSFSPQNWGVFSAGHVSVLHSVFSGGAQRWLATLDVTEATVNEGDTGLSAQVTLRDAESEQASAFSRAGSGEALTLHYAVVAPSADLGGASAADLRFAGSGASAASRPPCARCEAEFGAPLFNGSITLPANASGASIALPGIVNDSAAEGAERFTLILTGLRNSNGLPLVENGVEIARIGLADGSADYIIAANDGAQAQTATARLRATPRVVLQEDLDADATADQRRANVSSGVITILRPDDVQGVIRGRVRGVDVTTSGAADYTLGDTFEIAASEYSTTVAVSALADDITERNEVFQAEISVTAPNNVRGPESSTEVVILDNDRPITLEVAEAAVSVEENQLLEVKVQAKQGADPAPLRELPVEFLLTPSYPNSGAASAADFLVTVGGTTRVAQSDAEITVTGVLEPGETEASVFFPVADDGDTADEGVTFTVSLPPGNTMVNTLDGAISIGSSAATTATLTAASGGSSNTLVITPTTVTRVYGEAAPTAFA